jgi:hypothetical protein
MLLIAPAVHAVKSFRRDSALGRMEGGVGDD